MKIYVRNIELHFFELNIIIIIITLFMLFTRNNIEILQLI